VKERSCTLFKEWSAIQCSQFYNSPLCNAIAEVSCIAGDGVYNQVKILSSGFIDVSSTEEKNASIGLTT
jgi:hypothetical protein